MKIEFGRMVLIAAALGLATATAEEKPIALMGFTTDVHGIESEVMKPGRYVYESFCDGWLDYADYPKYSVLYFGEKMSGGAKGRSFKPGENEEGRAALAKFLDEGGSVIVGGEFCMRQLFGWPNKKHPDPLRVRVVNLEKCVGRMKANFSKAKKPLGEADDAGVFVLTPEGLEVQKLAERYRAEFAKAKNVKTIPVEGRWDLKPLGTPGDLVHRTTLANRPKLGKPAAKRPGLVLLGDGRKAVIVVPPDQKDACQPLAEELAWHLKEMSGEAFEIVEKAPAGTPALEYRTVRPAAPSERTAYMHVFREGDTLVLGGENTGKSRATTYVLECLGVRYLWSGKGGKVIPRGQRKLVLPEIDLEDSTSFVVRRLRLYGHAEPLDHPGNRDFYRWFGLNDMRTMTTDKPGDDDSYEWGHYYKDFYPKYYQDHRDWFALQPDGTRTLHIKGHPERPTFCLSNEGLIEETARRICEKIAKNPAKKCVSLCLPDGATCTQCMCEKCRALDPVNAEKSKITIYFPERRSVPYVASTDRLLTFLNAVCDRVEKVYPEMLFATYAYGNYTKPPVKVRPHRKLIVLSVEGYYSKYEGGEVERNLAAWIGFGNRTLWRPNAHGGFWICTPHNFGRSMFDDISLLDANGVFGVDYDTMYGEWAMMPLMYYSVCRAHFNPEKLDYDSIAADYCEKGFGPAAKPVRAYFDHLEEACRKAAKANHDAPPAVNEAMKTAAKCRLPDMTDFDLLDRLVAEAKELAADDAEIAFRLGRLEFGAKLGRLVHRWSRGGMKDEDERAAASKFVQDYLETDPMALRNHGERFSAQTLFNR